MRERAQKGARQKMKENKKMGGAAGKRCGAKAEREIGAWCRVG